MTKGSTATKPYKIKPKPNAKKAFDILAEKGGSIGSALLEAGFSEITAKTPTKVTETKGWKQLVDERLSDELLSKRHQELLNKRETHVINAENVLDLGPDTQAVTKGLDMAYKLKGNYAPEKSVSVVIDVEADSEVKALAKKLNDLQRGTGVASDGVDASSVGEKAQD